MASIGGTGDQFFALRALARVNQGKLIEAERDANEALRIDPQSVNGYIARAVARFGLGNFSASVADASEAILLVPNNAELFLHPGKGHFRLRHYEEALGNFEVCLRLSPIGDTEMAETATILRDNARDKVEGRRKSDDSNDGTNLERPEEIRP